MGRRLESGSPVTVLLSNGVINPAYTVRTSDRILKPVKASFYSRNQLGGIV